MSHVWSQLVAATSTAPAILIIALVVLGAYVQYSNRLKYRYPPGPAALPVLGNVHQLPMEYQQRTFAEWGMQYGEAGYKRATRLLLMRSVVSDRGRHICEVLSHTGRHTELEGSRGRADGKAECQVL